MADINKLLLFVMCFGVIEAYNSCTKYANTISCRDEQYCCEHDYLYQPACCDINMAVGAIVGIVIGGMFLFGFLVVVICVCLQKSKAKKGVVIRPTNQGTVAFVSNSSHTQQMPPPYGPQGYGNQYGVPSAPANMYGNQAVAPPPYGETQSVYPPHPPPAGFQTTR